MFTRLRTICLSVVVLSATAAAAEDAFYNIPVQEMKLVDGSLPAGTKSPNWRRYQVLQAMRPYAVLDGQGEVYVTGPHGNVDMWSYMSARDVFDASGRILIRAPQGKDVSGRLVVPTSDMEKMVSLRFTVPSSAAKAEAKEPFYHAKIGWNRALLSRNIPGGAWFRHQIRLTQLELHQQPGQEQPTGGPRLEFGNELTRTYDLFTGARAMSENLQLDRQLPRARPNETPVKIDTLTGITINEIDWKPLLKDAHPKLDALAEYIPADQHVVFFPSFAAAMAIADETKQHDTPVLRLAQPRSEDAKIVERYQTQLGLSMSAIARLLGPQFVTSVALTGSDPYYPVGTDVAVLFESPQPAMLENLLAARIALAAASVNGMKPAGGEIAGLKYRGFRSPDRAMSSYLAQVDDAVVVTNSPYQLGRIVETHKDKAKSIAVLPEYMFFRVRYPLGDADETALAFLSDATIRRWCGPRWRIADSRRTRNRAVLAELQASQLDALVKTTVKPGPIHTDLPILDGGELTLTPAGVNSSVFGSLDFMTPIGEIPLAEVTQAEADAYGNWRDGYQRNWSWGFDPIALRITVAKQSLAADMTVMPLILSSQYHNAFSEFREFASISTGGKFDPTAADPHDSPAQLVLAINRDSPAFMYGENLASLMGKKASLGWIGHWATAYVEDDPFWAELAKVSENDLPRFFERNIARVPVAVQIEATNSLQLAVFLTGARAFVQQTAPELTNWESLKYKDQSYVRITPAKGKRVVPNELENLAIYYTPLGGTLTVTLSEKLLKQYIDRKLAEEKAKADGKPAPPAAKPWLGSNVALRVNRKILEIVNALQRDQYRQAMQMQCWSNLPILNQWKRLYADSDPVKVHRQVWGVELVCPGGGKYVWNDKYRTMESTVYGHPGEPKDGPAAPPVLSDFASGSFGLTFEHQGVRARAELSRDEAKTPAH